MKWNQKSFSLDAIRVDDRAGYRRAPIEMDKQAEAGPGAASISHRQGFGRGGGGNGAEWREKKRGSDRNRGPRFYLVICCWFW